MKRLMIIFGCLLLVISLTNCKKVRRSTGRAYMPDMYYSRAYETYSSTEALQKEGVHYTSMPVPGTMARDDVNPYPLKNDSAGYAQSAMIKNPLDSGSINMVESERLYLVNCAICHGSKLDGNGPLWKGGNGPFPAAPKNFMDATMKQMTEGTMFHSVTYGKNLMGSYASQLNVKQRWMVIAYVKSKQGGGAPKDTTAAATPKIDSTAQGTK